MHPPGGSRSSGLTRISGERSGAESAPKNRSGDALPRHHPAVPGFHDALKAWSCGEPELIFLIFLSTIGYTKGRHNCEKPPVTVTPDIKTTEKKELSELTLKFQEHIIQAPKPVEAITRPSPDEPMTNVE